MKHSTLLILFLAIVTLISMALLLTASLDGYAKVVFSPYVDAYGNISIPSNFHTEWVFLGTWSVASEGAEQRGTTSDHRAVALHNVYTQADTVRAFHDTGKFPDGAVLIKELLSTETVPMTTGKVSRGKKVEGWAIMVKDTKSRFPGNKLWGDGWGWFSFDAGKNLTTKDYKAECLGCHTPAKHNDWVYVEGYPTLRKP